MYVLCGLITIVATLQAGKHISEYLSNPGGKLQKYLAKMGIDTLLDMVK